MAEEQKEVLRAQLRSKGTRNPSDMELYELTQLSGITMDPHVFEILLDLLRKNVSPDAIVEMLRSMCIPAYQQLHQPDISQQNAPTASTSTTATKGLSSGALRADHRITSSSAHTRSLQERSVPARQHNRRSQSDLHRGSQSLGSKKTYPQK